ncbi:TFIID-18kDa-domain-containing protein [Penicillium lagena]|uniref:TFIID-18kDa-domain-containing protein n=1 Tax=Penicillium lagena TaxID=94218 RepID=UPI00253F7DDD|nr:TFIID-18kDa-domain-containing protein [Penicillium lagena]KAJ5610796.1 TFIID-18kDa-domain-containing protein [Penicillium lagena]
MSASRRTGHPALRRPLSSNRPPASILTPSISPGHVANRPANLWLSTPQELVLLRAGYAPAYTSKTQNDDDPNTAASTSSRSKKKKDPKTPGKMAEPRARAARHKGQMNFSSELRLLLLAYGDPSPHPSYPTEPLPETVRVLDEIVTDFILEVCHGAAQAAHHARRQKIKVDDFRFALRRDPNKLGRVQELLRMERELKEARKAFDQNDDQVAKGAAGKKGADLVAAEDLDAPAGAGAEGPGKKGKGKGKRAAAARRGSDATEESVSKKRKTLP